MVLGALAVLLGLTGVLGGAALLAGHAFQREDGYLTTPAWRVASPGYAVVSDEAVLTGAWLDRGLGDVRLRAVGRGEPVFLGVAEARDAANYLAGVERTVLTGPGSGRDLPGGAPAAAPADADIWVASASGTGLLALETAARPGTWVAVLMSADGSPGVQAAVDAGATLPWTWPVSLTALALGAVLAAAGAAAMALAARAATGPR